MLQGGLVKGRTTTGQTHPVEDRAREHKVRMAFLNKKVFACEVLNFSAVVRAALLGKKTLRNFFSFA